MFFSTCAWSLFEYLMSVSTSETCFGISVWVVNICRFGISKIFYWVNGWMDGWIDGWMGGKCCDIYLLRCLILKMLTSMLRWFQIWYQNLSTFIKKKVMSTLSFKIWKFKADLKSQFKVFFYENTLLWWRKSLETQNINLDPKT